jgi:hypothetical protein
VKACFKNAAFTDSATFQHANFRGEAIFTGAAFNGDALFDAANFEDQAAFRWVAFKGHTSFGSAKFRKDASFIAMRSESYFTLEGTALTQVPNFEQSKFSEAPRLDNMHFTFSREAAKKQNLTARWRALRRIAIQAHDHEHEQMFFAEEIKARRGYEDRALPNPANLFRKGERVWSGTARYWLGWLYQAFSDFGRSLVRPVAWWFALVGLFTLFYGTRPTISPNTCGGSSVGPWIDALYLAIRNGSIVTGLGGDAKLREAYSCLYGKVNDVPFIPYSVIYVGLVQTVLSAILVFLFLLAVRSHFRIR